MSEEKECWNCKHENLDGHEEPCNSCRDTVAGSKWESKSSRIVPHIMGVDPKLAIPEATNDGSTADYYVLPVGATQLQDLIAFRNMNAQLGEIQRAVYRYGQGHHSSKERDLKKIIFYAQAELERIKKYES